MGIHLTKWKKNVLLASLLMGASVAQAAIIVEEQVLNGTDAVTTGLGGNNVQSGGNHVAIEGEWAFVGNTGQCQVFVYKWDPFTYRWGDGGHHLSDNTFDHPPIEGLPYTILNEDGNACQSNSKEGFGSAISTDEGLVAVGAPLTKAADEKIKHGSVFIYKYNEGLRDTDTADNRHGWMRIDSVEKAMDWDRVNDTNVTDVQTNAAYGDALSFRSTAEDADGISTAGVLIIGAPLYDVNATTTPAVDAGKVYVWEYDINFTPDHFRLVDGEGGEYAGDTVGHSVTSNGTEFLASAPLFDDGGVLSAASGAVYHFNYNATAHTLDLIHRFDENDGILPTPLGADFNLGWAVSYSDNLIAMSGTNTFMVEYTAPSTYTVKNEFPDTNGGDVSQSGPVINIAVRGDVGPTVASFNVYFDKTTVVPTDAPDVTYTKTEDKYGEDISLSVPRLMVNGYMATDASAGETIDHPNKGGVAYAYYPTCGYGKDLQAMQWKMIGPQCEVFTDVALTTPASIAEIFSPDLGTYGVNWIMFRQDGANYDGRFNSYWTMAGDESMVLGVGYWIMSLTDQAFKVNMEGATGPLYARHIPKVHAATPGLYPLDDTTVQGNIDAVTDLNLDVMFANYANGRDGDNDIRTMLSSQLTGSTVWSDAYMYINDKSGLVGNAGTDGAAPYFEGDNATAYVWHNGSGPIGHGYEAVSGTPGMNHEIGPGEGFSVNFSAAFATIIKGTTIPSLHITEQY